jgi:hypothetical protein
MQDVSQDLAQYATEQHLASLAFLATLRDSTVTSCTVSDKAENQIIHSHV